MANLKNITELPLVDSIDGINLIVNDNGAAKQVPADAIGKVKTINGFEPDENGNVEVEIPEGFSGSWNDLSDKPFYAEVETYTILENQSLVDISDSMYWSGEVPNGYSPGDIVTAEIKSAGEVVGQYTVVAYEQSETLSCAELQNPNGQGYAFRSCSAVAGGKYNFVFESFVGGDEVTITVTRETVKQIEEKYIPSLPVFYSVCMSTGELYDDNKAIVTFDEFKNAFANRVVRYRDISNPQAVGTIVGYGPSNGYMLMQVTDSWSITSITVPNVRV